MAVSLEVIRKLTVQANAQGVDAVRSQLEALGYAQDGVAKSADRMRQANDNNSKSMLSVGKQFDALERAIDPVARANAQLAAGQDKVQKALNEGAIGSVRAANALAGLSKRHEDAINATKKHGEVTGVNNMQMMEAAHVVRALTDEIVAGQDPIRALAMEAGRIGQIFSMGEGGVGGTMAAFGRMIGPVVTNPIGLIVAAAAASGLAMMRWKEQTDALTISLNGLGRASGLTVSGANAIAERAATGANISNASARGMATQFLGAGVRGPAIGEAIGVARDFGRKLGLPEDDAIKTLSSALAEPARGAEELSHKFGLLSYAQREEILRLQDMGDKTGAASKLIKDVNDRLKEMEDPTLRVVKVFDSMKKSVSDSVDAWGHLFYDPVGFFSGKNTPSQQKDEQNAQINATRAALNDAIGRQLGLDKIASDAALAAKEITAQTFAQREAIVIEKGRMQALLDTEHATQHLMEAEAERLRMMAEAQRKVEDYARSGTRDRYIAGGATPYERERRRIISEGKDLLRQIPTEAPVIRASPRPVGTPAASSGTSDLVAEAVRRGLEPTESNFQKLLDEGVGTGKFRGRLINMDEGFNKTTVNTPTINTSRMRSQAIVETQGKLQQLDADKLVKPYRDLNAQLDENDRLFKVRQQTLGQEQEAIDRATIREELMNQALREMGEKNLPKVQRELDKLADKRAAANERQRKFDEAHQKDINDRDAIRSGFGDTFGDAVKTAAHRGNVGKSLENSLNNIGDSLLSNAANMFTESLLGKKGSTENGLIGGVLGSLGIPGFSDAGGKSVGEMNVSAATVNVNGGTGIPGVGGASGLASGGVLGDVFKGLKSLWPFADGGIMTSHGAIPLRRYADGGVASSPQLAMFGEGSGPEAFVPLKNGGIPVHIRMAREAAQASASSNQVAAPNTEVHVHNAPPGTQTKESQTSAGGRRVDVMFADAVGGALQTGAGRRGLAMATSRPVQR